MCQTDNHTHARTHARNDLALLAFETRHYNDHGNALGTLPTLTIFPREPKSIYCTFLNSVTLYAVQGAVKVLRGWRGRVGQQVVEATTANGVCTLRVRAHALPQGVAQALTDNETLIQRAVSVASSPVSVPRSAVQSHGDLPQECSASPQPDPAPPHITHSNGQPPGPSGYHPGQAVPRGTRFPTGAAEVLADLAERLRKEAGEADEAGRESGPLGREGMEAGRDGSLGTTALLSRAWQFGPRGCGPNVLLAGCGQGSALWDVPLRLVDRISKRGGPGAPPGTAGPSDLPDAPHSDQASGERVNLSFLVFSIPCPCFMSVSLP